MYSRHSLPPLPAPFWLLCGAALHCAAWLSRTFIVAVEQRQGRRLSSWDLYPFVLELCLPRPAPLPLHSLPWHCYNCRIQCTHAFDAVSRSAYLLLLLPAPPPSRSACLLCLCASALAFVTCACEYLKYLCWLSMHLREYAEVELLIYQQRVCECTGVCVRVCVRLAHSYTH